MDKRRVARFGLAGALSTLYGAGALQAYKNPRPDRVSKVPWKTAVVAAGISALTFTIAAL